MGFRDRRRGRRSPEEAFADEVAEAARALLPVTEVGRRQDFALDLVFADGERRVMYLQNFFADAQRMDAARRRELIRRGLLAMVPSNRPATWAEAEPRLLPAVRAASWVVAAEATGQAEATVQRLFVPFVLQLTAIDDEHGMSFVNRADTDGWAVGQDTLEAVAVANLARSPMPVVRAERGTFEILGPEGYASSWLTFPDALAQLAGDELGGDVVLLAPSRDVLRVVGTRDQAALRRQLEWALDEYRDATRQLSPVPYAVGPTGVEVWRPPAGSPLAPLVERSQAILAATEYAFQRNVLEDTLAKAGEDVFVAQYTLMERDDGTVWSWAAWSRQVTDGLVPEVDLLCLGDNETKETVWVRWEDAERIAGDFLREDPRHYPPRWRVTGWPPPAVVDRLRQVAVNPGD